MYLNLAQLRSELGNMLKAPSTVSTSEKDLWLNMAQDDVATSTDPENLLVTSTLTSVASTRKYYLDYDFNKIAGVVDTSANTDLTYISESDIELIDPKLQASGTPFYYTIYGTEFVRAANSTAGTVSVVSSSASDTSEKVRIRGQVGGVDSTEILTLNGLSTVTGTLSWDASSIYSVAKDGTTTGNVTATRGADTIAVIPATEYVEQKQPIFFWPTPSGADTYRIRGYRRPRKMVNAEDYPDLPTTYHELVLLGAVIRGHKSFFRYEAAKDVMENSYVPMLAKFQDEQGNKRAKTAPIIIGGTPNLILGGRYPSNFTHW